MLILHHHHLYHSIDKWIASILPLLLLLVQSFHLKYIILFCRRDLSHSCPFSAVLPVIKKTFPFWHFSINDFFAHTFGAGVRGCRSYLYLSSTQLLNTSLFSPSSDQITPTFLPWLSPVFNTQPYRFPLLNLLPFLHLYMSHAPMLLSTRMIPFLPLPKTVFTIQLTLFPNQT